MSREFGGWAVAKTVVPLNAISDKEIDQWCPPYDRSVYEDETVRNEILHISELFSHVVEARASGTQRLKGYPTTCWPVFNEAFGGLRGGEVTVITAETGAGKTTFALNWAADYAKPGENGVFYVSVEMSKQATAEKLAQLIHRKPVSEFDQNTDFCDLRAVKEVFKNLNFWFFDHYGRLDMDRLTKAIWYAVCEKRTRLIVIDHLGYLIRQDRSETQALAIGNTMRDLSLLANQLNVSILLVVHPGKLYLQGKRRLVDLDDLKGSSDIKQEASNVISLFKPDRSTPETYLYFLKIRSHHHSSSVGGRLRFDFDHRSLWLSEVSDHIEFSDGH